MSSPSADEDDISEYLKVDLEERAADVVEDGEFLTFEEHNEQRE